MGDVGIEPFQYALRLPLREHIPDDDHPHLLGGAMRDGIRAILRTRLAQDQGDIVALGGLRVSQLDRVALGAGKTTREQDMGDGKRRIGHGQSVA